MLELRKTSNGFEVRVKGGTHFPLPSADEVKANAINAAVEFGGEDCDAVHILNDCDFDFEIVPGKDAIEELIGIVITTSRDNAAILQDVNNSVVSDVMSALMEACPDIGSDRIVERGERPKPTRKPKRSPRPQRADASAQLDQFVRQLTAAFINQGRKQTAFGEAARWGHLALIKEMLNDGIDVNARTETGCTALMLAASGGQRDIVQALIAAGADVNVTDRTKGMTAMMWNLAAVHSEDTYAAVLRELLNAGADRAIVANDGKTAHDWAREREFERLLMMLADD